MPTTKNAPTAKARALNSTSNGTAIVKSPAGWTLTQLRYCEEADLDAVAAAILHVIIRAADNTTRTLRMSQAEIARRTKLSEKTVYRKLAMLEEKGYILRESQPSKYGRSWDKLTMIELDERGNPVAAVTESVGLPIPTVTESVGDAVAADSVSSTPTDSVSKPNGLPDCGSIEEANASSIPTASPSNHLPFNVFVSRAAERTNGKKTLREAIRQNRKRALQSGNGHREISPQDVLLPQDAHAADASPDARSARNIPEESPTDSLTAGTHSNSPASQEEIIDALSDCPWDKIHEPCEQYGLGLLDLEDFGFHVDQRGYLYEAPPSYEYKVQASPPNKLIIEAWDAR